MIYEPTPSQEQLAIVRCWLAENGPLIVDDFWCHAGGSTPRYFIRSVDDLLKLISQPARPRRNVSVFRNLFPLRGIANDELLEKAAELIGPDDPYEIALLEESNYFPYECQFVGEGWKGYSALKCDLQNTEVAGRLVAVGPSPFAGDESWFRTNPDVLRFELKARGQWPHRTTGPFAESPPS